MQNFKRIHFGRPFIRKFALSVLIEMHFSRSSMCVQGEQKKVRNNQKVSAEAARAGQVVVVAGIAAAPAAGELAYCSCLHSVSGT